MNLGYKRKRLRINKAAHRSWISLEAARLSMVPSKCKWSKSLSHFQYGPSLSRQVSCPPGWVPLQAVAIARRTDPQVR
ncbi:uncharacterized protein Dvir_GJ26866 [Drosophila virilis]|uniref:Uncharacterized protein n=1 Tax=Drosophila virilis TaxID=7244 RepID=A0A0Q9WC66_DROVI|nr:uncharacterized protein Dvir_GJ26866 [Drosophila virilis]